jgi:DNA-binding CsgD family transcriptional regulator
MILRFPSAIGSAAEQVVGAGDEPARLTHLFYSSPVPMVIVDGDRRHLHANPPALLAFRAGLREMRESRIDDRTPPNRIPALEALWKRLVETGRVTGHYDVANLDGTRLRVVFYALADALPGQHLIAFAPESWSDRDLAPGGDGPPPQDSGLTRRELELLQLAARGRNGPRIAEELALSPGTVKTHFANMYAKLGVRDRSAAVAKAMRLGLID